MAIPLHAGTAPEPSARRSSRPAGEVPPLALTPALRRRWPFALGVLVVIVVLMALLATAIFHTQLAERQIRVDAIEREVNAERDRFDQLRYRRAVLRSPVRLAEEAASLGMVPGLTGSFVELDGWQIARQLAATGVVGEGDTSVIVATDPLAQVSEVKRASAGRP